MDRGQERGSAGEPDEAEAIIARAAQREGISPNAWGGASR
jgi:hypothetical protein